MLAAIGLAAVVGIVALTSVAARWQEDPAVEEYNATARRLCGETEQSQRVQPVSAADHFQCLTRRLLASENAQ